MADVDLLNRAIERFNSASSTLTQYYNILEDRVRVLTGEVEQKKQLLNSILDSIDVGVIFFDREGTVKLMNRAAGDLLHVRAEDITGGASIFASIEDDRIVPQQGRPFEALISRSDVSNGEGDNVGHVLIFKDISRLRELERENERNRRLSAMGELVMKIAHEIRNPLGSIELFASLLSEDLRGTGSGAYADRISTSVRSLVNTLDNMLRFTKGINPRYETCSLPDLFSDIGHEFSDLFNRGKIRYAVSCEAPLEVSLDRGLMRQALINLIINAVQAMPEGGMISVSAGRDPGHSSRVVLSVRDTGTGMDSETASRIFEPFFSTKDRGTGLGMSIAEAVVAAHGGTVAVRSEEGKGTEFTITIPDGSTC